MPNDLPLIGFIGTGIMGKSMAAHLLNAGYSVTVYNRTKEKADPLLKQGARWANTPADAAKTADVVLTIVGYPHDVRAVYLEKNGILETLKSGGLTIDLTTSSPSLAQEIFEAAQKRGVAALDAPVTGGDIGAREARLSIMVGGETTAFQRALPILNKLGKAIVHHGPAGAGQNCKLCNQIAVAGTMIGLAESIVYAQKSGLNLEAVLETLSKGAGNSYSLGSYGPRILKKDFEPGFMIEHFVKDMGLVLDECKKMKIELPGLQIVRKLYEQLMNKGMEKKGTQSLVLAIAEDFNK
jgi:3-hydroxyisobutyrate dehydrogenase